MARGEATAASDVDLLVEFEPGRSLLDQVHLIAELEALLGKRVDTVAESLLVMVRRLADLVVRVPGYRREVRSSGEEVVRRL